MNILVTGAKGFIGSVFCRRAAEQGHHVIGLDNESRGLNSVPPAVMYERYDVSNGLGEFYSKNFQGTGFQLDAVVHLAAATGSLERPLDELRFLNVETTKRVYTDARALGVKKFVFPTTSLQLAVPDSPYVISKEEAYKWLRDQDDGPDLIPVRFFNVAGSYLGATELRLREVHAIPLLVDTWIKQRARLQPMPYYTINGNDYNTKDGTPARDYTHVVDVVDFMLYLLTWIDRYTFRSEDLYSPDGTIHIGAGGEATVLQLIDEFNRLINKSLKYDAALRYTFGPRRPYDTGTLSCHQSTVLRHWRPMQHWKTTVEQEISTLLHHWLHKAFND